MNDEKETETVGRFFLYILAGVVALLVLTGCTSAEQKQEYRNAQVEMVRTQVQSREQIALQREQAQAKMWEAAAEIVKANPESAPAFAVVMGVRVANGEEQNDAPMVSLQREENEALAVVKAVAPALVTTLGTVGVAAIQADVNKTQSNNAARVAIADATTDADIMRSVTGMAEVGLNQATTQVGGDYYVAETLDQSSTQTMTETNTTTNTITETLSESSTEGSYNTTDSYNDNSDNSNYADSSSGYQSADGSYLTREDIITLLQSGASVRVLIGDEEVEVTYCDGELGFGPSGCVEGP